MSRRRRPPRPSAPPARPSRFPLLIGGLLILAGIAAIVLLALRPGGAASDAGALPGADAPQPTDSCRALPGFTRDPRLGLSGTLALATDQPQMGLVLLASESPSYQHPSWDDAGYLGAIAYDREGNVYAAPTPRLSLVDNPLLGATTLWRIDGASAEMRSFITLPGSASGRNPFGVLGLTYSCELNRLYAGSVIGSTPTEERGGVVAISLPDLRQSAVLEGTDVLGVLVVRAGGGYELYAGLARSPEIIAVPLDAEGDPAGPARALIDLTEAGAAPSERARKLRLVGGELVADIVPFNYSLQTSAGDAPQSRRAVWRYDQAAGGWVVRQPATAAAERGPTDANP